MMFNYFSSSRYYQQGRKIQILILLITISLVCTATQSGQSDVIKSINSESPVKIKESVEELKLSDKNPGITVSQPPQIKKQSVQQGIKKLTVTSGTEKRVKISEPPLTIAKDPESKQDVTGNPNEIVLEKPITNVIDKQIADADDLNKSENKTVAPKAKNVDLEKPIQESEIVTPNTKSNIKLGEKDDVDKDKVTSSAEKDIAKIDSNEPTKKPIYDKPFLLLGSEVPPGTTTRLAWSPSQSFQGISAPTPVLIVNGIKPGPVLCLTAAVHGDELNGIEIVRRVLYNLKVEELSGTVIGVPIVNLQGFRRSSRYLPDRRDLNRFFPGDPLGSSASRIAYSFFHEIITHCNVLVDLHTGSFHRTNLPQLRANLNKPSVLEITQGFGATVIIQSEGAIGTLRRAAVDNGIAAVTLEAGEPMRLQEDQVSHGVKGIKTLMNKYGMYDYSSFWGDPEPVYYQSKWVRADIGGILFSQVDLGEKIKPGDLLGTITDPITNVRSKIKSSHKGRIIGMALNQFVMPGFAAFHVGIHTDEDELINTDKKDKAESNDTSENKISNTQVFVENEKLKSNFGDIDELYETE